MTIYAVMEQDCGMYPCHILSVWSRREDAEREFARLVERKGSDSSLEIRAWALDQPDQDNLNS